MRRSDRAHRQLWHKMVSCAASHKMPFCVTAQMLCAETIRRPGGQTFPRESPASVPSQTCAQRAITIGFDRQAAAGGEGLREHETHTDGNCSPANPALYGLEPDPIFLRRAGWRCRDVGFE